MASQKVIRIVQKRLAIGMIALGAILIMVNAWAMSKVEWAMITMGIGLIVVGFFGGVDTSARREFEAIAEPDEDETLVNQ